jgi:hypothetical protein
MIHLKRQTCRKTAPQNHRSKGFIPYDSGIAWWTHALFIMSLLASVSCLLLTDGNSCQQEGLILELLSNLLNSSAFMPHGFCYLWRPDVLWLNVGSDLLIGLAYFTIPLILLYFLRQSKKLPYPWVIALFAAFILLCGTTHFIAVWAVWEPV